MNHAEQSRNHVEIDLSALAHNARAARVLFPDQSIMAVLKGDAYGHGIENCAPILDAYVDWYAVATVEEGLKLRETGTRRPILLLGPVPGAQLLCAAENDLTLTLSSLQYAERYAQVLRENGLHAQCQIKIDTGLNRTGISWRTGEEEQVMMQLRRIHALQEIQIAGTYTHLACPESEDADDRRFTQMQLASFDAACEKLASEGLPTGLRHCCSTGSALLLPHARMDMVRIGMLLYGQCFSEEAIAQYGLRPVLRWVSSIAQLRSIKAGESVSYGRTYRAQEDMRIAVVTAGYADGYRRAYSLGGRCIVRGKIVPVIGRVCMDYLMLDVTDVPCVQEGDEVTLLGAQDGLFISANALSDIAGSVSGEVTAAIAHRVPRICVNRSK